jgi:hypothetical protein
VCSPSHYTVIGVLTHELLAFACPDTPTCIFSIKHCHSCVPKSCICRTRSDLSVGRHTRPENSRSTGYYTVY